MNAKQALRNAYREKRKNLTQQQMHARLAAMLEHFREIPIKTGGMVLSFQPILQNHEVPIQYFEDDAEDVFSISSFCYPAADFGSGHMQAFLGDENIVWEEADFGLTQPRSGTLVMPHKMDSIFIPLLAFDEQGNRLGYGKGFYDRYLQTCRPDAQKIGFSWFEAEILLPSIDAHDVPLNYCVTPNRLYVF